MFSIIISSQIHLKGHPWKQEGKKNAIPQSRFPIYYIFVNIFLVPVFFSFPCVVLRWVLLMLLLLFYSWILFKACVSHLMLSSYICSFVFYFLCIIYPEINYLPPSCIDDHNNMHFSSFTC